METQIKKIFSIYGEGVLFFDSSKKDVFCAFFANNKLNKDLLRQMFSNKKVILLKQTHSDIVVNADVIDCTSEKSIEGDAAYSTNKNFLLAVQTADCTPLLFIHKESGMHGFIHAGWRGVANQILIRFLQAVCKAQKKGCFFVGPHITQKNFEVDLDVAETILKTIHRTPQKTSEDQSLYVHKNTKVHIRLLSILQKQLLQWLGSDASQVKWDESLVKDVYDDLNYHSYRRDKQNSGRNLSFTMILSKDEIVTSQLFLQVPE